MIQNIVNNIEQLNALKHKGVGIIIGNFDGVHRGHQFLIEEFVNKCKSAQITPVVLTFNPHPIIYLNKKTGAYLLNTYDERNDLLLSRNIEVIVELDFNKSLQQLSSEEFFKSYLFEICNLKLIYLGHDFSLGNGKVPAKELLEKMVAEYDVNLCESKPFYIKEEVVSSSSIREYLKAGNIKKVSNFLGREYCLCENVVNGYGVGKKELVPTANIQISPDQLHPKSGVYFTKTKYDNKIYDSITNIGFRPSLQDDSGLSIETNILNFSKEIYQQKICIEFLKFHRDEKKFESKEELLKQIHADIKAREQFHD